MKIGDNVKTYLHGYKKIKLIGNKLIQNNPAKNYKCMYNYKGNILSGEHNLMVENIDDKIKLKNRFYLSDKNMIDDKYCLMVCDHNESMRITELITFKIYHLVLEGKKRNYCIYIENEVLSESTTEENFNKHFLCN